MFKVTAIGKQYVSKIELPSGEVRVVGLTKAEYRKPTEDMVQIKIKSTERRATLLLSEETVLFDTTSGFLEEEQYADNEHGGYWVRLKGRPIGETHLRNIVSDSLLEINEIDYGYST